MSHRSPLIRLAIASLLGGLSVNAALAQSSTFPQFEKMSCPSHFTTSGGKCTANEPGWVGMINPKGTQSCPPGFARTTNYCYKKTGDDKPAKKGDTAKSASSASSSSDSGPRTESSFGGKPAVKRVTKRNELDYCPTGYHTSGAKPGDCITPWPEAPDVSVKKGSCPAGTTEEQGQYCTSASTLELKFMDAAHTRDFNALYIQRSEKGLDTSNSHIPALLVEAKNAAKPAAQAAEVTDATTANPSATAEPSQDDAIDTKAAAALIGGALKGLFSR